MLADHILKEVPSSFELPTILICEDSVELNSYVKAILKSEGYDVKSSYNASECLELYSKEIDLVILDIQLPEKDGFYLFNEIKKLNSDAKIIFMTAFKSIEQSVEALKMGAMNYIGKPITKNSFLSTVYKTLNEEIQQSIRSDVPSIINNSMLKREESTKISVIENEFSCENIFTTTLNRKMRKVYELVEKVANSNLNVSIIGESGTGKEHIAKLVHNLSWRYKGKYVAVDCPSIPSQLFESEIFGHKKGAFTGAKSDKIGKFTTGNGGTIFLDEIADLDISNQAKLLRALQEKEFHPIGSNTLQKVDIRVVSATSRSLIDDNKEVTFRPDLYYRLAEIEIRLPSLRERKEDIPYLAEFLMKKICEEMNLQPKVFSRRAINQLVQYDWPGNIRELKSLVSKLAVLTDRTVYLIDVIPEEFLTIRGSFRNGSSFKDTVKPAGNSDYGAKTNKTDLVLPLRYNEKKAILSALEKTKYNYSASAKLLGISRSTLYRKLKKYKFKK
jgi:DNA-binding NtrC family response regulator